MFVLKKSVAPFSFSFCLFDSCQTPPRRSHTSPKEEEEEKKDQMSLRIINVGSINIDEVFRVEEIVKVGQTIASLSYSRSNGGKGANQSVAAALAGGEVWHVGKIGRDGHSLIADMKDTGVLVDKVIVSDKEV